MNTEIVLLTLNEPNLNGRIYSSEAVQKAIDNYKAPFIPVQMGFTAEREVDLEKTVGEAKNLRIEGNKLLGTIKLISGKEYFEGLSVRPSFIGKVSKEGVVSDIELLSMNFTNDPA